MLMKDLNPGFHHFDGMMSLTLLGPQVFMPKSLITLAALLTICIDSHCHGLMPPAPPDAPTEMGIDVGNPTRDAELRIRPVSTCGSRERHLAETNGYALLVRCIQAVHRDSKTVFVIEVVNPTVANVSSSEIKVGWFPNSRENLLPGSGYRESRVMYLKTIRPGARISVEIVFPIKVREDPKQVLISLNSTFDRKSRDGPSHSGLH